MSNVRTLPGIVIDDTPEPPNTALVEQLKELLAMAESGTVRNVCAVALTEDGSCATYVFCEDEMYFPMLGGITELQRLLPEAFHET